MLSHNDDRSTNETQIQPNDIDNYAQIHPKTARGGDYYNNKSNYKHARRQSNNLTNHHPHLSKENNPGMSRVKHKGHQSKASLTGPQLLVVGVKNSFP